MLARIFLASRDFLISCFTSSSRDSGNGCLGVEMDTHGTHIQGLVGDRQALTPVGLCRGRTRHWRAAGLQSLTVAESPWGAERAELESIEDVKQRCWSVRMTLV